MWPQDGAKHNITTGSSCLNVKIMYNVVILRIHIANHIMSYTYITSWFSLMMMTKALWRKVKWPPGGVFWMAPHLLMFRAPNCTPVPSTNRMKHDYLTQMLSTKYFRQRIFWISSCEQLKTNSRWCAHVGLIISIYQHNISVSWLYFYLHLIPCSCRAPVSPHGGRLTSCYQTQTSEHLRLCLPVASL